ncbi:MAG: RES domain-containing protein [Cyanobacteria bacterium J06635_13]
MVLIPPPPPDPRLALNPQITVLEADTILRRIYNPSKHNTQAITFRHFGPRARFDHQRCDYKPNGQPKPQDDSERGINYWGYSFKCCLVEVFGDTRIIEPKDYWLAKITLTQPLKLLNLIGDAAMKAGTVHGIGQDSDRLLSQAWGKYFYEMTSVYGLIDGLKFKNAHNDDPSIALFERARPQLKAAEIKTVPLASSALRPAIIKVALDCSMIFD